jgi:hypothetical protein
MKRAVIAAVTAVALTLVLTPRAAAQAQAAQATPSPRATLDEVLAELRALRAELTEVAHASLRAQLLVARLALQEQRITTVSKELADVYEKLQANDRHRPIADMLKAMAPKADEGTSNQADNPPQEANFFLDAIRGQAEQLEKSDAELKARYAELSRLLADEQSRWAAFNAQLEALETKRR